MLFKFATIIDAIDSQFYEVAVSMQNVVFPVQLGEVGVFVLNAELLHVYNCSISCQLKFNVQNLSSFGVLASKAENSIFNFSRVLGYVVFESFNSNAGAIIVGLGFGELT